MKIELSHFQDLCEKAELSGKEGLHRERSRKKIMLADTDMQAIHEFLDNMTGHKTNTYRAYLIESERLLLWAIYTKQKPISSLAINDYQEYFNFLDNPAPQEIWCQPKKARAMKRWSKDWKPFTGPLSLASKSKAIAAINKMLKYWFEQGYIDHNPMSAINLNAFKTGSKDIRKLLVLKRSFSEEEWSYIIKALESMPVATQAERKNKARIRFIVMTLIYTGLRRDELARLTWGAVNRVNENSYFVVNGKSGKPQIITLPSDYVEELVRYRNEFYQGSDINIEGNTPLITSRYTYKAISATHLNNLIKELLKNSSVFAVSDEQKTRLLSASAHWFRHTAATFLDKQKVDPMIIKKHMRHQSFETTEIYIHKEENQISEQVDRLKDLVKS